MRPVGPDGGVDPMHGGEAGGGGGGDDPDHPTAAGDCSSDETLSTSSGHLNLLTGETEQELFCHKLDSPPDAVFFTEDFCFRISADGTGTLDTMGGYDHSSIQEEGFKREDAIVEFVWGGLVDGSGGYQIRRDLRRHSDYWQRKGTDMSVDRSGPCCTGMKRAARSPIRRPSRACLPRA